MQTDCKIETKKLVLLEQSELALYNIQQELERISSRYLIGTFASKHSG